jgi:Icc-related predicted phosphoesterase
MRILHTSDWHLGSRLYDFDRTEELFSQVERVCQIARDNNVDVLLVVGDIFERMLLRDSEKRRNLNRSKRKNLNTRRPYYPQFIPRRGLESGTARVFVSGIAHNPEPSRYSELPR